jgi:hypothetical protein
MLNDALLVRDGGRDSKSIGLPESLTRRRVTNAKRSLRALKVFEKHYSTKFNCMHDEQKHVFSKNHGRRHSIRY